MYTCRYTCTNASHTLSGDLISRPVTCDEITEGEQGQHTVRMASAAQNTKMTKGIIAQSGEIKLARSRDYLS